VTEFTLHAWRLLASAGGAGLHPWRTCDLVFLDVTLLLPKPAGGWVTCLSTAAPCARGNWVANTSSMVLPVYRHAERV
jgi:hypothetical protein